MNRILLGAWVLLASCSILSRPDLPQETQCNDGLDNDGNGQPDCRDPSCADEPFCAAGLTAVDDSEETPEDQAAAIPFARLLENDIDPEGESLRVIAVGAAINGSVKAGRDFVEFLPAPNFNGEASFTYTIEDPSSNVSTGTVTVTVTPVNDPVGAIADGFTVDAGLTLEIDASELLANDIDIDGDTLSVVSVDQALNGVVSLADDTITVVPDEDADSVIFNYTATDGLTLSSTSVVVTVVNVNDPPLALDDDLLGDQDTPLVINFDDLLGNDSDPDNDTLTIVSVQGDVDGVAVLNPNDITFTPAPGFSGSASFSYTISDGQVTATALVSVEVLPAACGNGLLQGGEACDDGNQSDNDGCSSLCALEICGDLQIQSGTGEQCDDGNLINNDACTNACLLPACGDGVAQGGAGEQCDDGNTANGDGCDAACILETPASCGDGAVDAGEGCDDGNMANGDGCNAACQLEVCSDGIVNNVALQAFVSVEFIWLATSCEGAREINFAINGVPALTTEGDSGSCSCFPGIRSEIVTEAAVLAAIQDGINSFAVTFVGGEGGSDLAWAVAVVNSGASQEALIFDASGGANAQSRNPDLCEASASNVDIASAAEIETLLGEGCDDGNTLDGDGCNAICQLEVCGDGLVNNGNTESCDDDNTVNGDGCNAACQLEVCGDGLVNNAGLEQCDDGNQNNLDGCRNDCALPTCGDNVVDAGEACDDGNNVAGDGCRANCSGLEVCGDLIVDSLAGEQCDDGNTINNDGCDNQCILDPFNNVPAQLISGGLSCATGLSNTGRKISSDALGNFYAVMNCGGEAFVVSSTDRGFSYTAPLSTGITGISEVAIEGGPANTAYVAAISGSNVTFTRTIDGGATWEAPIILDAAAGDAEISVESFGDNVYLMYSVGSLRLLQNNTRGQGAFVATDIAQSNVFHDVIIDKIDESVIAASDDPAFHLRRSTDGGVTFADELNPPGQAFFSDWTGSNGFIYVVGTNLGDGATDIDVIPTADLSLGNSIQGLPSISTSNARAIDADAIGNAYVVSQLDQGGIQLDRMLFAAPEILSSDARPVSAQGSFPGVAALPSNNGAVIVFTNGTEVFAAVEVYPVCGDGVQEGDEQCEDGNTVGGDGCDAECFTEVCGNGIVQPALGEECDDNNTISGDGCAAVCLQETGFLCAGQPSLCAAICGDGVVLGGETCDDANVTPNDGCSAVCLLEVCGDGIVNNAGLEACDDGNLTNGDGCSAVCVIEFCGDNVINNGEACDDGNNLAGDGCRADCLSQEVCGDGFFDPAAGEGCDDGNNLSIDGCDAACVIEFCGDNIVNVSGSAPQAVEFIWLATSCNGPRDINFALNGTTALTTLGNPGDCRCDPGIRSLTVTDPAVLGLLQDGANEFSVSFVDGTGNALLAWAVAVVNSGTAQEVILFDNNGGNDAQSRNPDLCGASFGAEISATTPASLELLSTESCDDGATINGDGCSEFCQLEVCGDGIVNNGTESCDDGNLNNGDGCSSVCAIEPLGGDGFEISNLTTDSCQIVEHNGVTGDDRGGIAVGSSQVLYTGDNSTGAFDVNTLVGASLGVVFDSLFSDLGTGTIYTFGNGATPIQNPGGTITSLLEIDPFTGVIVNQINLSQAIAVNSFLSSNGGAQNGIFAGMGRVVLLATPDNGVSFEVFDINISTGQVLSRGVMAPLARQGCENWATWGVVELRGNALFLTYTDSVFPVTQILRTRVPDGFTEVVNTFTSLSEMCSFTVAPLLGRWYFHFEGNTQLGGSDESIGFCNALVAL